MLTPRQALSTLRSLAHRVVHVDEVVGRVEPRVDGLCRSLEQLAGRQQDLERRLDDLAALDTRARARHDDTARSLASLHDTANLVARRTAFTGPVTRAVFLVHHIEAWDSYDELYRLMEASDDFVPVVVSIPRNFAASGGLRDEELVHDGLAARGVPHVRASADRVADVGRLVKLLEPDVVLRQSQWDADIDPSLSTASLTFARQCIVSYGTMNLVENVPAASTRNTAVDSELHRSAWLCFCANEDMLATARKDNLLGGAHFRAVGHPKADMLRNAAPFWPLPGRGSRVAWSSHHSIGDGWTKFGTFPQMAQKMLEWAREGTAEFVWMPHPALVPYISTPRSPMSRDEFDAWLEEWSSLDNTAVFTDGYYAPLLAGSEVMLTDGLSMLVEYQVHERPVVYVEREGHRPFTTVGQKVMRGVHTVGDVSGARTTVETLLRDGDPLAPQQRRNVTELLGAPGAAGRVLDVLRAESAVERGRSDATDALGTTRLG